MEEHPSLGLGHRHRDLRGGAARAAVFGISDGLVTNVSLILGVAGAHPGGSVVRLAGLAGLVAGAFSMGAGEFVSMRAQRELFQHELDVERQALVRHPEGERRELQAIYTDRGIEATVARQLADEVHQDPELALQTHAREELGIDPAALGQPVVAALSSFATFALGAFIPLLPWLFTRGGLAVGLSIGASAVTALVVGAGLSRLTGRSSLLGALRQLLIAAGAAAITYGIGRAVGAGGLS